MKLGCITHRILAALAVSLIASGAGADDASTALGGGLGAAAGAAIGQSVSKKNGAVVGGAIGGAVGGAVSTEGEGQTGAMVGGAVGGATGAAVGKSVGGSSGAVVGAGVGGAAGAVVGKNVSTSSTAGGTGSGGSTRVQVDPPVVGYSGPRYDDDGPCKKWKHKKHPGKGWAKGHYKKRC